MTNLVQYAHLDWCWVVWCVFSWCGSPPQPLTVPQLYTWAHCKPVCREPPTWLILSPSPPFSLTLASLWFAHHHALGDAGAVHPGDTTEPPQPSSHRHCLCSLKSCLCPQLWVPPLVPHWNSRHHSDAPPHKALQALAVGGYRAPLSIGGKHSVRSRGSSSSTLVVYKLAAWSYGNCRASPLCNCLASFKWEDCKFRNSTVSKWRSCTATELRMRARAECLAQTRQWVKSDRQHDVPVLRLLLLAC